MPDSKVRPFWRFLGNLILVFLGALLALVAMSWQEKRAGRSRAAAALHEIVAEIGKNRELLGKTHEGDNQLLAQLKGFHPEHEADPLSASIRELLLSPHEPPPLSDAAWEAARASGSLRSLRPDVLLALTRAYSVQSRYQLHLAITARGIYTELLQAPPESVLVLYGRLITLVAGRVSTEQSLLDHYAEVSKLVEVQPEEREGEE